MSQTWLFTTVLNTGSLDVDLKMGGLIPKKRPLKMDDKSMDPTGVQCRLSSDKQKYVSQADMGPKKSHQKGCRLGLVNQSLVISDKSYIYIYAFGVCS